MSDHLQWPSGSLPQNLDGPVARLCREFETAWRTGQQPKLEAFLTSVPDVDRFALLRDLLRIDLHFRRSANEAPSLSDYRSRFPDDALAIVAAFREAPTTLGQPPLDSQSTRLEEAHKTGDTPSVRPEIPGYQILDALPSGGMGIVYRARQVELDRIVALKMIRSGIYADPQEIARFRIESEAIASLSHAHVIPIYDWGEWNGMPYLTMEFAEMGSLAEQLEKGPLSPGEAADVVEKLSLATQFIHERDIIHRDLKPANILLTKDGTPKLADFGLAKRLDRDQGLTQTQAVLGTASYMAPEQAAGSTHTLGPAVDVYALGAILYELLTGRPPFRAATREQTIHLVLSEDPPRPTQIRPEIPLELEWVCLKCLEKTPEHRFGSAQALADSLTTFRRGTPLSLDGTTLTNRLARAARRSGFEILDALGADSVVRTFRARDLSLGRIVVLELLGTGHPDDEADRERLRAQATAAANLHHANIVELYSFGELDGDPFVAREYVESEGVRAGQPKPAKAPKQIASDVESLARAVHHAHLRGVVHGNLEPGKVVRDGGGICKITGYGVGTRKNLRVRELSGVAEVSSNRSGLAVDPSEDLAALGAILYQLLNGHPPQSVSPLFSENEALRNLNSGLPGELRAICQRCLDPDPARRYVNAAALAEDLRRARVGEILLIDDLDDWLQQRRWARRGGYKIVELLAQGESGFTYKAIQIVSERRVVLKRISARYRFVPAAKEQFRLEGRLLAGLHHPNIATLFDMGELNDLVYYAREYVDGQSLARWAGFRQSSQERSEKLQASESSGLETTVEVVCALARTIQYLHDQKLVHGGLNPSSVHVTPGGVPRITGLRRAKSTSVESAEAFAEIGPWPPESFLAPEQLDGARRRPERTVDIYALGAILSMLLGGRAPISPDNAINRASPPAPTSPQGALELENLEAISRKCMATDPSLRFATASAVADELKRILN
jgi:eukaryotic-like serine/threonine-protein kinase